MSSTTTTTEQPAATQEGVAPSTSTVDIMMQRLGYKAKETAPDAPAATEETEAKTTPSEQSEPAKATPAEVTTETPRVKKAAPVVAPPPLTAETIAAAVEAGMTKAAPKVAPAPAAASTEPALSPEDQSEVELATFASSAMPDKYKELPEQMKAWVKQRDAFVTAKAAELGGARSQEFREFVEGEEYKDFIKTNRPSFRSGDRTKLEREKIKAESQAETDRKLAEQRADFDRKIAAIKLEPVINEQVSKSIAMLLEGDDEVLKAYRENPTDTIAARPLEGQEIHATAVAIQKTIDEYLRVSNGLIEPDAKNPMHKWLDGFITEQGKKLDAMPPDKRTRNGRLLVSHATFDAMKAKDPRSIESVEVFNPSDVATLIVANGRINIDGRLKQVRESIRKSGFERPAPVAAVPDATNDAAATADKVPPSPKAGTSRAPGHRGEAADTTPLHLKILSGRR